MRLLDTNVFVRLIAADNPAMTAAARTLFERLEQNQEQVKVLPSVITEVVYVLTSSNLYDLPRAEVRDRLAALLVLPAIVMDDKLQCLRALELHASYARLSITDALIAAAALEQPESEIYSFDRDFDGVPGVRRVEP